MAIVVDRFDRLEQLELVRSHWQSLYASDSSASVFLSWEWIAACLATENARWAILAVRDDEEYLAFLPLRFSRFPQRGPALACELSLGLSARADFTGMLGAYGQESRFLPALASEIQRLAWDDFILNNCNDRRIAALVAEFGNSNVYRVASDEPTPCPYVKLPATWDEYLDSRGKSTRRTIRARLNKLEALSGYHLQLAPPEEAESAIDGLLRLHSLRWKRDLQREQSFFREFLRRCYLSGCFAIYAMFEGTSLMATQGFFIDRDRRTIAAYLIAFNPQYAQYSPGLMLGCASVRWAIKEGYQRFDLSLGAQSYKISLSTDVAYITNTTISRRNARAAVMLAGKCAASTAKQLVRKLLARAF